MGSFYSYIEEELNALDERPVSGRVAFGIDVPVAPSVKMSTVIAALRQAAKEMGYVLPDPLAALMVGQLRAEGAYPGVGGSLGGTNNMGAAQAPPSLAKKKQGLTGWGAFAHLDTDPIHGPYIGWYYIAPSALEAARHWLGQWWGSALLKGAPQTPEDYATILYKGGYFQGFHAEPSGKADPTSDAGQANIADYSTAIRRGVASQAELAAPADDPAALTVDPAKFKPLAQRKITKDMYDKAKAGGTGYSWASFLPGSWDDFVKTNGAFWFGPPPYAAGLMAKLVRYPIRTAAVLISIAGVVGTAVIYATGGAPAAPAGRRRVRRA